SVDGSVTVDVPNDVAQDAATNNNTAATQFSIVNDQTKPSVVLSKTTDKPVSGAFTVLVKFSENIFGFDLTDLSLSAGTKSDLVQVDQSSYTVLVKSDVSSVDISMAAGMVEDMAGNMNTEPTSLSLEFNSLPSDIGISNQSINENSGTGALVGQFNTLDNEGDIHTYTLISGTGDADNNSFTINGVELLTAENFDFETKSNYSIRVKSTDSFGEVYEKTLEITILNLPEAQIRVTNNPVIPSTALGSISSFDIVISNDGDGDLIVTEVAYFVGFTGVSTGFTVSPASSKTLSIDFSPTEEKTYSGNIVIKSNLGETSMAVSAIGEVVTGIDDGTVSSEDLLVYPNPANDFLTIDLSNTGYVFVNLDLIDMKGLTLLSRKQISEKVLIIDVSSYSSGIYLVVLSDGYSTIKRKIIIEN
ncbi:T9SS type A sorting domain-containing protein, partial [Roseivirga seohaensis]|uniref:T9SS type A sorting domain-containing protein n=1 Tax=Roseivirga seohaensis TaxID=1914963 RepID=UPI000A4522FE